MLVSAGLTWIPGDFSLVSCWFGWFRRGANTVAGLISPASSRWFKGSRRPAGSRPILPR